MEKGENIIFSVYDRKIAFERSFEKLVQQYQQIIDQLTSRIDFLEHERSILLTENTQIRTRLESFQHSQSLEILIEQASLTDTILFEEVSELTSAKKEKYVKDSFENSITMKQYEANEEFLYLISQKKDSIKIDENVVTSNIRTPILHQPIFKHHYYRSNFSLKGLIRAFYIKILTLPECITNLIEIIEKDYKYNNYEQIYLFSKYPDNTIIGNLMIEFLNKVSETANINEIIQLISKFKLYDDILCQILLNKLQTYVNINQFFNQQAARESFHGLSNIFELIFVLSEDGNYQFYRDIQNKKRLHSQQSDYLIKVQEEISLNPGRNSQSKCFVQNNYKEPLFLIEYNNEMNKFQFLVKEEILLSESQFESSPQPAKQFNCKSSFKKQKQKDYNYFLGIQEQLFHSKQKQQTIKDSAQSREQFRAAIERYYKHRYGSNQSSMLLSSYNNSLKHSKQFMRSREKIQEQKKQEKRQNRYKQQQNVKSSFKYNCSIFKESIEQFICQQ